MIGEESVIISEESVPIFWTLTLLGWFTLCNLLPTYIHLYQQIFCIF